MLISVNPFRDLGIYTDEVLASYRGKNRLEVPPHVFAVAESSYYNMNGYKENQCIIIRYVALFRAALDIGLARCDKEKASIPHDGASIEGRRRANCQFLEIAVSPALVRLKPPNG